MITIKQLNTVGSQEIHAAFTQAFADYVQPFDLNQKQLLHMLERRGFKPELSFGAFAGNQLVGFTLNGVGNWNGLPTAYDTGSGMIKNYRKQGIITRMFRESLPVLRAFHLTQYLLEVIRTNTAAYQLYKKAGFEVKREFDYFSGSRLEVTVNQEKLKNHYRVQEIENPDWNLLKTFWDFEPSWQNSIEAIQRKCSAFVFLGAFEKNSLVGYGIIEKTTGDLPQIAIAPKHRQKGAGTKLIHHLLTIVLPDKVKIINTEASNRPFKQFATSLNLEAGPGQYEMLLKL